MTFKSGPTSPANPASATIASPQLTAAQGPAAVGEALKIKNPKK